MEWIELWSFARYGKNNNKTKKMKKNSSELCNSSLHKEKKMNVAFVLLPRSFNCAVLFVCVFPRFSSSHPVELFVLCCLGLLSWCIWTQLIPFELHILCHHEKIMLLAKDRIRYLLAEQTIKTTTIWSTTACIEPARGRQRERAIEESKITKHFFPHYFNHA